MQLYKRVSLKKETGLLPICQNEIQGLFKDFQGPYEGYIIYGVLVPFRS